MIEVHHFKIWSAESKHWEKPPSKRSAEAIAELKGEIIPETGQMVFKAMLDSEGRFFPPGAAVLENLAFDGSPPGGRDDVE